MAGGFIYSGDVGPRNIIQDISCDVADCLPSVAASYVYYNVPELSPYRLDFRKDKLGHTKVPNNSWNA